MSKTSKEKLVHSKNKIQISTLNGQKERFILFKVNSQIVIEDSLDCEKSIPTDKYSCRVTSF